MWTTFFVAVAIFLVAVRVFFTDDKQFEVISAGLNHLLPHTTFGFTKEREERYVTDPSSLLTPVQE